MAALTGLLGDYGSDDESAGSDHEAVASIDDVELTESGVASSRPASALPADVDAAPEVADDRALPEANTVMSPDQPSQFQLPPDIAEPPDQLCSAAVQEKVVKLLWIQSQGRFLNAELRSSRPYRNPDFLSHTVKHFELDPHGTCYPQHVYDPNALHKEDYYDKLTAEYNLWRERKTQQQQQNQRVEFVTGGTEKAAAGPSGLQTSAQVAAMQAKAQAVVSAAQHKGGRNKWDAGPPR
ncbi:hypothetical protein ABBQ38_013815 [Trebouxia sp. C0009 RCD-2024]